MSAHIRASIIVVTHNSARYIDHCLAAIVATTPSECEIIVVDNASVDDTSGHVARSFPE